MTRARRRVFVTGIGAVTPLGESWSASLPRLVAGESAVAPVERFDVDGFPCRVAAPVAGWEEAADRRVPMVRAALAEALGCCGGIDAPADRIGVFLGAESGRAAPHVIVSLARAAGGPCGGDEIDHARFAAGARALAARIDAATVSPAAVTSAMCGQLGARGPAHTVSIACASGAIAIADAVRSLRLGLCDVAVCGGVGADVDPFMLVGFGKLGALSERGVSRPFDLRRDGFVVGEGAAVVVLGCQGPGLGVEVTGIGASLDAHHLTAPDPEGAGACRAMRAALCDAGRDRVDYVQAHGTSTPLNDQVEAKAIRAVLGDAADRAAVGSVKGAVGHWIAGAGAVGFVCAVEAVRGTMLPTANLVDPDPACALDHVIGAARRASAGAAMVNAFAFGGANCSLVLEAAG